MQGVKLENNIIIIRLPQAEKILLSIRETWKYRKIQANQSGDNIESVTPPPFAQNLGQTKGGVYWLSEIWTRFWTFFGRFPFENHRLGCPKSRFFRACGGLCPYKSTLKPPNLAKSWISENLAPENKGGVYWLGGGLLTPYLLMENEAKE